MNRRHFAISLLSFIAVPVVDKLKWLTVKTSGPEFHVCSIEIEFPYNSTLSDFFDRRKRWMKISEYDRVISKFENEGLLLKRDKLMNDTGAKFRYYFKDQQSHDAFVSLINAADTVNDTKLKNIGYKYSRKYYRT